MPACAITSSFDPSLSVSRLQVMLPIAPVTWVRSPVIPSSWCSTHAAVTLALVTYLIGAVWLVMSLKSGLWNPRFLLAIPVIWSMFLVLYGVVTLVSVWTGSSALSLMVVLALLFASLVLAIPELETQIAAGWRPLVVGLRHALPRFPSVGVQLVPQLATGEPVGALGAFANSLGIGGGLYALAFWHFSRRDF